MEMSSLLDARQLREDLADLDFVWSKNPELRWTFIKAFKSGMYGRVVGKHKIWKINHQHP